MLSWMTIRLIEVSTYTMEDNQADRGQYCYMEDNQADRGQHWNHG